MILNIHVFGSTTSTGEFLKEFVNFKSEEIKIFEYSRKNISAISLDLEKDNYKIKLPHQDHWIINLSPIWIFSSFMEKVLRESPIIKKNLKGIICCSSTSVLTKKYSFNNFDKNLSNKLYNSELKLIKICSQNAIPYTIVRSTLIYGNSKNYLDKNINKIISILSYTPIAIFPEFSGLRQPIHASQLAEVLFTALLKMKNDIYFNSSTINVGGDNVLTYFRMIKSYLDKLPNDHPAKKTKFFQIPNRLFFLIASPLLLLDEKIFASILRINSNLSGFIKASEFCQSRHKEFPIIFYKKND